MSTSLVHGNMNQCNIVIHRCVMRNREITINYVKSEFPWLTE